MDTRHLRAFLKIAETRSISRAAETLGIAQPSLSQQLLRLEDEVGVPLFRRSARGVTLTEAGRIFLEHARQLLRGSEQAIEEVRQFKAEPAGAVALAVPHTVSRLVGVDLVEGVIRTAPQISLRLTESFSTSIRSRLEEGEVDLGLLHDRDSFRHLAARPLVREELFLIGPAGRFVPGEDGFAVASPAEIDGLDLIAPGHRQGLRGFLQQEAARMGFSFNLALQIDAVGNVAALVERGHGMTVLPLPAVAEEVAAGRLSVARIGDGSIQRTLCLVRNPAQVVTHASLLVEDLLIRCMAAAIAEGRWNAEMLVEAD